LPLATPQCPFLDATSGIEPGVAHGGPTQTASFSRLGAAIIVAFCALFCAYASGQTAHFAASEKVIGNSTSVTTANGTFEPLGVASDAVGNLYVTDSVNNLVVKGTPTNSGYVWNTIVSTGLSSPQEIAVDSLGNLFIADLGNSRVAVELPNGSGGYTDKTVISSVNPNGVAVDAQDNVYYTTGTSAFKGTPLSGGGYNWTTIASDLTLAAGIAVDTQGNVYICDFRKNVVNIIYSNGAAGGIDVDGPQGIAVDGQGTVYVANPAGLVMETQYSITSTTYSPTFLDYSIDATPGVAVDGQGTVYVTSQHGNYVFEESRSGANFGTVSIGTASPTITLTFTFDTAGTLAAPVVLTQGATGGDFADAGTGSCRPGSYVSGNFCTVDVTFTPEFAGSRYGAVELQDANGNLVATGYVQGVGSGPQMTFLPGVQSTVKTSTLNFPAGVAVDGSGNVFFADYGNGKVFKETLSAGSYSESEIGSNLKNPNGIALDGAGNLYIADYTNNTVLKETLTAGSYNQSVVASAASGGLSKPSGVAVDGMGNLYIADDGNKRVLEEEFSGGSYTQIVVPITGLALPTAVAVDNAGNLYIADYGNTQALKETLSAGSYIQSTIATGLSQPEGISVDENGIVYIADSNNNQILKETPTASGYTQSVLASKTLGGLGFPSGVAIAGNGNVYISDSVHGKVVMEDYADVPTLNFASTAQGQTSTDSPQTVTVENIGNAPLTFSSVAYPVDFPEGGAVSSDCTTSTSLNANETCTLTVEFSPTATIGTSSSALSEVVGMLDNNLNSSSARQMIAVNGTETPELPAATPTFSPAAGTYTSAQSVTISDTTPGAQIYYTTDGSTPTTSSNFAHGPITVSSTETIQAIAVAAGYGNSAVATGAYTIGNSQTAAPTFSPAEGTYTSVQTVTISDTTPGATIYYTTDGTIPTTSSNKYTGPITVSSTETIVAIAVANGYSQSGSYSAAYTINIPTAAGPTFSPAGGTYTSAQTVTISDTTPGATIYYTTGGTIPTTSSNKYTSPIQVSANETIMAIAVANGYAQSGAVTATYTINISTAAAPTFSPAGGTYTSAQTVTISDTTSGATIYYTTDGSAPTTSSTKYTGPITVSSSVTIEAIAVATGYANSAAAQAAYSINIPRTAGPTFSPAPGTYTSAQTVTISDATSGAVIYYTTDGTGPTTSSTKYTGPIQVSSLTNIITAIAVAPGDSQSGSTSATYYINLTAATPTFSPAAGTYSGGQQVTVSDATPGAAIYYTTDGSTPTANSTLYTTSGIKVVNTETVNAIAIATGYTNSTVATAAYTINPVAAPNFAIAVAPATLNVTGGQSGTATVSVTPQNGFASAVSFTCSGLPAGASCSFSPATVTPSGTAASTTTLTVSAPAPMAAVHSNSNPFLPGAALAAALCFFGFRKRRSVQLLLLLAMGVIGMSLFTGCGGSFLSSTSNQQSNLPAQSTVTVTGTSGTGANAIQNSSSFSLMVY
jgi:streptogramin lyase